MCCMRHPGEGTGVCRGSECWPWFQVGKDRVGDTSAVVSAFSCLSSLQSLCLEQGPDVPAQFLQALQSLMRLTALHLPGHPDGAELHLPTSLQKLGLCCSHDEHVTWGLRHPPNLRAVSVCLTIARALRLDAAAILVLQGRLDSLRVIGGVLCRVWSESRLQTSPSTGPRT